MKPPLGSSNLLRLPLLFPLQIYILILFVVLSLLATGRACPPSKLHCAPRFPSYLQLTYHRLVGRSECAQVLHYFLDLGELRNLEMKVRLS